MAKFNLVKISKNGKLSVFDFTGKINQRNSKKEINKFRREIKKENPNAKISVSFKVKHKDADQDDNFFWNSLPLRSVDFDINLPVQYMGRIVQISLQVIK